MDGNEKTPAPKRAALADLHVRLPAKLLAAVDARVRTMNAAGRWPRVTRTDLLRQVIQEAVKR